jgi:uncharacterized membrane protein YbhN (UPF0104 family)
LSAPARPRWRRWGLWLSGALFVASLAWLLARFSWTELAAVFASADLGLFFFASTAPTLALWGLRALRWRWLLRHLGVQVPIIPLYLITGTALGLSNFTPAQSGEALKIEWLRRVASLPRANGYGSFLIERLLDLYVLGLLGIAGALAGVAFWSPAITWVLLGLLVTGTVMAGAALLKLRLPGRAGAALEAARALLAGPRDLLTLFLLTLGGWALIVLTWWLALKSVSLDITYHEAAALVSGLTVLNVLSLIPGGLGLGDAALAELLVGMGYPAASAQAGALAVRATALVGLGLSGLFALLAQLSRSR